MQNSVLTTRLSLPGHSSAARQCQTPFWVVLYSFSYGGWGGGKYVKIDDSCFSRLRQVVRDSMGLCWWAGIGDTCLAPVTYHSAETLLAIIKACILPSTTVTSDCCGYNVHLLNEGLKHHTVDCSIIFVAHWCSQKYDRGHMEARQGSPQALLRKRSWMCDK